MLEKSMQNKNQKKWLWDKEIAKYWGDASFKQTMFLLCLDNWKEYLKIGVLENF